MDEAVTATVCFPSYHGDGGYKEQKVMDRRSHCSIIVVCCDLSEVLMPY